jgi:hypothetical protein
MEPNNLGRGSLVEGMRKLRDKQNSDGVEFDVIQGRVGIPSPKCERELVAAPKRFKLLLGKASQG